MTTHQSNLDWFLSQQPPDICAAIREWYTTRPPAIQRAMDDYPPGTHMDTPSGVTHYIVGYKETDKPDDPMVIISPHDPAKDYDEAVSHRIYICISHLTKPVLCKCGAH